VNERESPCRHGCVKIERLERIRLIVQDRLHLAQKLREIGYSPWLASHCSSHLIV
jgi:abortive infection bacteriophage resistance protein